MKDAANILIMISAVASDVHFYDIIYQDWTKLMTQKILKLGLLQNLVIFYEKHYTLNRISSIF